MNRTAVLLFCAALCGGCVSASKFKAEAARADGLEAQAHKLRTDLEASRKAEADLTAQLGSINAQLASVQKSNQDLQESLEAKRGELTKKVSELVKEKDALAQRLADAEQALRGKESDLARALEEKKAVEAAAEAEMRRMRSSYEELAAGLKAEIAAGEVKLTQLKGKLSVNLVDRILFDSGQAEVRQAGKAVLSRIAGVLNSVKDKDVRIEGHTDNVPIGGELKARYPSNWELSTARATAVARYLEEHGKVDPRRLISAGYGEFRPVAPNDTPENRALNRRIEIALVARE